MTVAPASAARPILPRRVAILGFARSGRALAKALVDRGVEVALAGKQRVCFHAARSWSAKPRNPVVCPCAWWNISTSAMADVYSPVSPSTDSRRRSA